MIWSFVQSNSEIGQSVAAPVGFGLSYPNNVTKGNILVLIVGTGGATNVISGTIIDSQGNTWSQQVQANSASPAVCLWTTVASQTSSNTVSGVINNSGVDSGYGIAILEYSNGNRGLLIDTTAHNNNSTPTNVGPGSVAVNYNNDIVIVGTYIDSNNFTYTAGSGFTNRISNQNITILGNIFVDDILNVSTAQTDSATLSTYELWGSVGVSMFNQPTGTANGTSQATAIANPFGIGVANGVSSANGRILNVSISSGNAFATSDGVAIGVVALPATGNANGDSRIYRLFNQIASGGVLVNGSFSNNTYHIYNNFFSGGILLNGTSNITGNYTENPLGGVVLNGLALTDFSTFIASGGVLLGGSANNNTDFVIFGGVVLGGTAGILQSHVYNNFFSGNVSLGGTSNIYLENDFTMMGGVLINGIGHLITDITASGGIVLNGATLTQNEYFNNGTGGVIIGGSISLRMIFDYLANGGVVIIGNSQLSIKSPNAILVGAPPYKKPDWLVFLRS